MKYALEKYFPMLQSREEVLEKIREKKELSKMFDRWEEGQKEEFLDFCTGARGVKMLLRKSDSESGSISGADRRTDFAAAGEESETVKSASE